CTAGGPAAVGGAPFGGAATGLDGALTSVVVPAPRSRAKTARLRSVLAGARSGASEVKASTPPSAESDGSVTEPFALATCSTAPLSRRRPSTWLRDPCTIVEARPLPSADSCGSTTAPASGVVSAWALLAAPSYR